MPPELQSDVKVWELALYAILNPATIVAAFFMGRRADQPAKLLIAAFAGAIAGVVLLYAVTFLRLWDAPSLARASGGFFVAAYIAGLVYAFIGSKFKS